MSVRILVLHLVLCVSFVPCLFGQDDVRIERHRTRWERVETWRLRYRVDFGPEERVEPRSETCDAMDWNPHAVWSGGMVRIGSRSGLSDAYLGDFVEGERANLALAVESGTPYFVILTLGDAKVARGPVRIQVDDRVLADSLVTGPGEFMDVRFKTTGFGKWMTIRFESAPCRTFAVNGVALYAEGAPTGAGRRNAPVDPPLPATRTDGDSLNVRARRALGAEADYLMSAQPPEGGFSRNGAWYETSFPVRALLAAARVLDETRYKTAALAAVDRFVAEKLPGGGWSAHFFGTHGCPVADSTVTENRTRNLADVGSMALALAVAAADADPERSKHYVALDRSYSDSIVLPAQLASGAFPNGRFDGKNFTFPYTVATAVQAAHLSALYRNTHDTRYQESAERAALFLARSIERDGSVRLYPHDKEATLLLPAESVGDLFYVVESLLWVHPIASPAAADTIAGALDRYFRGGSLASLWQDPRAWLQKGDVWERSKRAGILYLLEGYRSLRGGSEDLDRLIAAVFGALENPAFAKKIGVGAEATSPESRYGLGATGFAAIGVAALLAVDSSSFRGSR
jgi:hypothetical protein